MTRLAKVPVEQWDPELRAMMDVENTTELERGVACVMALSPAVAKATIRFGMDLFGAMTLPARLVELVRLRISFHNQCRTCMVMRYSSAIDDGLTEALVCSLERPSEAPDLTDAERSALAYADLSSTDHFSIADDTFNDLRRHFSEAQIVELGTFIAYFIGFGRLDATWDLVEILPDSFQDRSAQAAPWRGEGEVVRR